MTLKTYFEQQGLKGRARLLKTNDREQYTNLIETWEAGFYLHINSKRTYVYAFIESESLCVNLASYSNEFTQIEELTKSLTCWQKEKDDPDSVFSRYVADEITAYKLRIET